MKSLCLLIPLLVPAAAAADPPSPGYLSAGGEAGADTAEQRSATLVVEGGYRIAQSPVLVHALVGSGVLGQVDGGSGAGFEGALGAEVQACREHASLCPFVGLDVGVLAGHLHDDRDPMDSQHVTALAGGRVGLQIGADHLTLRLAVAAARGSLLVCEHCAPGSGLTRIDGSAAIAYAF